MSYCPRSVPIYLIFHNYYYAEVLRQPAFVEELQQKYRVVVAGPATMSASRRWPRSLGRPDILLDKICERKS
jgi:hypothetical protein